MKHSKKISKSSLNKASHKCRLEIVPQSNCSTNVWFLSTVTNAKWVFMLLKHVNTLKIRNLTIWNPETFKIQTFWRSDFKWSSFQSYLLTLEPWCLLVLQWGVLYLRTIWAQVGEWAGWVIFSGDFYHVKNKNIYDA